MEKNILYRNKLANGVIKSDISSSAQSTTLCETVMLRDTLTIKVEGLLNGKMVQDERLLYILSLQFNYGLRISEVLAIQPKDISSRGVIKIRGSKGSDNRICIPLHGRDYFLFCKENNCQVFAGLSRWYVYREYKKLGINLVAEGSRNNKVTHAFRYSVIKDVSSIDDNIADTANFIGHKKQSNTLIYAKKQVK